MINKEYFKIIQNLPNTYSTFIPLQKQKKQSKSSNTGRMLPCYMNFRTANMIMYMANSKL